MNLFYHHLPFVPSFSHKFMPIPTYIRRLAASCGIALGLSTAGWGATYYVDLSGNDSNPGSKALPWRTVQKAANTMTPGDSVLVAPGDYGEAVSTKLNGTAASPIRFRALGEARLSSFVINNSWQEVSGFYLNGAAAPDYSGLIDVASGVDNCLVQSNTLSTKLPRRWLVKFSFTSPRPANIRLQQNRFLDTDYNAVVLTGSGHIVKENYWTSQYRYPLKPASGDRDALQIFSDDTLVVGNVMTNWTSVGIGGGHPDLIQTHSASGLQSKNVVIEGNLFIDCYGTQIGNIEDQAGLGLIGPWTWRNNIWINVEYVMGIFAQNMTFYNNLLYRSGRNSGNAIWFAAAAGKGSGDGARLYNNIFVECGSFPERSDHGFYSFSSALTNCLADYNLVIGTGSGTTKNGFQVAGRESNGINGVNPLFLDPLHLDFRLQSSSPCIGAAMNLNGFFNSDFTGAIRGAKWDIGPLQYFSRPIGVTNLTATLVQ